MERVVVIISHSASLNSIVYNTFDSKEITEIIFAKLSTTPISSNAAPSWNCRVFYQAELSFLFYSLVSVAKNVVEKIVYSALLTAPF